MVWIRNLPGPSSSGSSVDGASTFKAAIESQIEIDYQLSQAGRGLKYASDPTLLIKEPAFADRPEFVRSPADAIVVSQNGDAKLLEINGTASTAVIEYCRGLREMALGNHARQSRQRRQTVGGAVRAGAGVDVPGADLAGRSSAAELRRGRPAAPDPVRRTRVAGDAAEG
jgi:hypothetical protein